MNRQTNIPAERPDPGHPRPVDDYQTEIRKDENDPQVTQKIISRFIN